MSGYEVWKILHILSAAVWFGAGVYMNFLMGRLASQQEFGAIGSISKNSSAIERFFDVAAILTLVFGVIMVLTEDALGFGDPFITVGFAGIIVTLGIGHALIGPTVRQLGAALEAGDAEAAQALGPKVGMLSTIDSVILLLVIAVMVVKPAWW